MLMEDSIQEELETEKRGKIQKEAHSGTLRGAAGLDHPIFIQTPNSFLSFLITNCNTWPPGGADHIPYLYAQELERRTKG